MKKRKICIIITTRGNYAKMKSVMSAIRSDPALELQVIIGGGAILPKYGDITHSIEQNELRIDRVIHFLVEGENPVTMAKSAGLAVTEFSTAFENLKPNLVFIIADRFECLAIAMAATYMNIPLAHVEGGEVSGSIDESIRHAITKLSHLHFPATKEAAERIERLGEDKHTIFTVGCSSLDVIASMDLNTITPVVEAQGVLGVGARLDLNKPYLIIIQHPVTTEYDANLAHINQTIAAVTAVKMNTVWIWPNMDAGSDGISKGIRIFRERERPEYVHFFKSLPIEYFAPLLKNASCIVGNSSSGIREAGFLGTPCVNIGSRQQGRQRSKNVMDVDYDSKAIAQAIQQQVSHGRYEPDYTYGDGKTGQKIAQVVRNWQCESVQKKITY